MRDMIECPPIAELAQHACSDCGQSATASVREGNDLRVHWDCGRFELLVGALSATCNVHFPSVERPCGGSWYPTFKGWTG